MSHEHSNRDLNRFMVVSADLNVSSFWQTRRCLICCLSRREYLMVVLADMWMCHCFVRHLDVSLDMWMFHYCFGRCGCFFLVLAAMQMFPCCFSRHVSLLFQQTWLFPCCFGRRVSLLFRQTGGCFLVLADMCCFSRHVYVSLLFWQRCECFFVVSADM